MSKNFKKTSTLSVCTFIGIAAVLLTIVSDLFLIGSPISAYEYFIIGTEAMAHIPLWRIAFGTFLGVIVIPMQVSGLVPLYYVMKPAGKAKALAVVLPIIHGLFMAAVFHVSYVFLGAGWNLYYNEGQSNVELLQLLNAFEGYWRLILIIIAVCVLIGSIFYSVLVFKKKTLLPKWMAYFNPIGVFFFMFLLIIFIPAPVGGYIAPTYLNMSTLVFIIMIYLNCEEG